MCGYIILILTEKKKVVGNILVCLGTVHILNRLSLIIPIVRPFWVSPSNIHKQQYYNLLGRLKKV